MKFLALTQIPSYYSLHYCSLYEVLGNDGRLELGRAGATSSLPGLQLRHEMSRRRVDIELAIGLRDEEITRRLPHLQIDQRLGEFLNPLLSLFL